MKIDYDYLRKAIKDSGMSQTFVAEKLGRQRYYFRDIIRQHNDVPIKYINELCETLNTPFCELTGRYPVSKEIQAELSNILIDACQEKHISPAKVVKETRCPDIIGPLCAQAFEEMYLPDLKNVANYLGVSDKVESIIETIKAEYAEANKEESPSPELSKDELEMLNMYRMLNYAAQAKVVDYMEGLLDSPKNLKGDETAIKGA